MPFFGEIVFSSGVQPNPCNLHALIEMFPPYSKKLQFLKEIINYLNKYLLATPEIYKSLRRLISVKTNWTWNRSYQELCNKAENLIKEDTCMMFMAKKEMQYLETDTSGVGLGAWLLQIKKE